MTGQPQGEKPARGWFRYRVLAYFVFGLAAVDLLVFLLRPVWQAYTPDDYRERVANCRRHPADLVVVGGSPVAEGVDPALLVGLPWHGRHLPRAFGLGLSGATTLEIRHAVRHALAASPPQLLVYGITASDLNDSRLEPHGPRSLMDLADLRELAHDRPGVGSWAYRQVAREWLAHVWQLSCYRCGIRLWLVDHLDKFWPGLCPSAAAEARLGRYYHAALQHEDGFAPQPEWQAQRLDRLKAVNWPGKPFSYLDNYRLGENLADLHRLLDWAEARRVAVVLVDMPVTAELEEQRFPAVFARYRAALAEVGRSRGVPILSASRAAVELTDEDFADWIHLNAWGTARLSAWLRVQLTQMGCAR